MIYLQLFLSYLKIGFFGFGGGYAMLSLIQHEVVISHQWISNSELTDIIAISQMTPGPISINSATYIGYVVTGNIWGAILATFAVCLPSITLMIVITRFYIALQDNLYCLVLQQSVYQKRDVRNAADDPCDDRTGRRGAFHARYVHGRGELGDLRRSVRGYAAKGRSDLADRAVRRGRLSDIRIASLVGNALIRYLSPIPMP